MTDMQTLAGPSQTFNTIATFVRDLDTRTIPDGVTQTAKLMILDLIGVLAAGTKVDAGRIARNHATRHWAAGPDAPAARLLFDGRKTSLPGFGFAMATQIDSIDAHDGWNPSKGHAGAAIFPALCAFAEAAEIVSGRDALAAMIIGYEISYRAALALHKTVPDYHTSGAWNALGCVAISARLRNMPDNVFRHALGIAEYHGPRSQMMREIANPSMLHDGSGWGAPTGIYSALIAEDGFTGCPAATVEFNDATFAWSDLNRNWLTTQQYIKPYPTCRWAHAPIDAALKLRREHKLTPDMIERVTIATFTYAAALNQDVPTSSPHAQYSMSWPVAAALVRGHVGVDEILEGSFADPEVVAMTARTSAIIDDTFERAYPEHRKASVTIELKDGRTLESGPTIASGGPDPQPTQAEVVAKFRAFTESIMPKSRARDIETRVLQLESTERDFKQLLDVLVDPVGQ